jgi:sulfate adenylyltransferase subunit 1
MDILRFITAGSVDDGKSTLIGRLLYDTKNILADQLEAVEKASKTRKDGTVDLALLTDGLRSEREQGITIDVAYKYFQTPTRKFISIDAPGHVQYTRNMVTGASNADLAIILVDARQGIVEQTRRHSLLVSLLGIPSVVVAINKMDLVGFSEDVFLDIAANYQKMAENLGIKQTHIIPVSALDGDNIVEKSVKMDWYEGQTLLELLESVNVSEQNLQQPSRFPVQFVLRPQTEALHDYRGYAGRVSSGILSTGDAITVLPSGVSSTIERIEFNNETLTQAQAGQSVVIHLSSDVDVSRGDVIVLTNQQPKVTQEIEAIVCWMDESKSLNVGNKYVLQHNTARTRCSVRAIDYQIDIHSYEHLDSTQLKLNDIGKILLKTANPLAIDSYQSIRANGSMILIDETSNATVGAVMVL